MFVIYIYEFAKSRRLRGNVIKLIVSYVDCVGDMGQNNNYLGLLSAWVVGSSFLCMSQKSLCCLKIFVWFKIIYMDQSFFKGFKLLLC